MTRWEGPGPAPRDKNAAGREVFWSVPHRTLQHVMDHIAAGGSLLEWPATLYYQAHLLSGAASVRVGAAALAAIFLVLDGVLDVELRDRTVTLGPGELYVVPRGVEHRPVARRGEVRLINIEPGGTHNLGEGSPQRPVVQG